MRDMVFSGRDVMFLFIALREETVLFDCVRDRTAPEPRMDVEFDVERADAVCDRVVFFATAATAPSQIGTAKNMAKNRFRPFISLSVKDDSKFI